MNENRHKNPKYKDLEPYKEQIISRYNNGESFNKIALSFKVHPDVIKVRLRNWKVTFRQPGKTGKRKGYGHIPHDFWTRYRIGAEKRKIPYNISIEEIDEIFIKQNGRCVLSNKLLQFNTFDKSGDGNISLDRKDSTIEYRKDNCQLVTKRINVAKNDMGNQEILEIANEISEYNNSTTYRDII
jgi:hypothetical protein